MPRDLAEAKERRSIVTCGGMGELRGSGAQRLARLRAPVLRVRGGCRIVRMGSVQPGGLLSGSNGRPVHGSDTVCSCG